MSWDEFLSDYIDEDGDGENDTFRSWDIPERITVHDRVVSIEYNEIPFKHSVIILESDPEWVFFQNSMEDSIEPGDIVLVVIDIIEGKESDGDRCEDYDFISIRSFDEGDNRNRDGLYGGRNPEKDMPWIGWFIVAAPFMIGCLLIYLAFIYPKRKKKKMEQRKAEKQKESEQTYYCPDCSGLLKYKKKQKNWYCRHCKENHTGLNTTSYDFGTIREQY